MSEGLECEVTAYDSDGNPWPLKVRASSLYRAVFSYHHETVCGSSRGTGFPKLEADTAIQVKLEDGRVFRTTFGAAMKWANLKADGRI